MNKRFSTLDIPNKPTFAQLLQNQSQAPFTLDEFSTFLEQTHCVENLTFWMAVRHYKYYAYTYLGPGQSSRSSIDIDDLVLNTDFSTALENLDDETTLVDGATEFAFTRREERVLDCEQLAHFAILQEKMNFILKTYIVVDAPREVNIPNTVRRQLLRQVYEHGNYHPAVLVPPRDLVSELMRNNSFLPWLHEQWSTKMLKQQLEETSAGRSLLGRRSSARHSWAYFSHSDSAPNFSSPPLPRPLPTTVSSSSSSSSSSSQDHASDFPGRSMNAIRKRLSNPFGRWMQPPTSFQPHPEAVEYVNRSQPSLPNAWS